MNGIFRSITPSDLLNSSNRKLIDRVAAIWDRCVAPEADYGTRDNVILVDLGHWLQQGAWADDTGYFLKFRLHPLYKHLPATQRKAAAVLQGFLDLFPQKREVYFDNRHALEGNEDTVTVVVHTASHSIGD